MKTRKQRIIIFPLDAWDPRSPQSQNLRRAGLEEETLRRMDPDERVAVLERARLDPYDYIYLAL